MELPSAEPEMDRYENRPLLLILENYILDCIGELDPEKHAGMTTLIRKIFGGEGDWRDTVREVLEFDYTLDDELRQMWAVNQQMAVDEDFSLHPVQFAKMCSDENFSQYFEDGDSDDSDESDDNEADCDVSDSESDCSDDGAD